MTNCGRTARPAGDFEGCPDVTLPTVVYVVDMPDALRDHVPTSMVDRRMLASARPDRHVGKMGRAHGHGDPQPPRTPPLSSSFAGWAPLPLHAVRGHTTLPSQPPHLSVPPAHRSPPPCAPSRGDRHDGGRLRFSRRGGRTKGGGVPVRRRRRLERRRLLPRPGTPPRHGPRHPRQVRAPSPRARVCFGPSVGSRI